MARALVSLVSALSGDELKLASVSKLCAQAEGRGAVMRGREGVWRGVGRGAVMQGIAKVGYWRAGAGVIAAVIDEDTKGVSQNVIGVNMGAIECNGRIERAGGGGPRQEPPYMAFLGGGWTCKAVSCNVSARTQSARRINSFNMLCMHVKHNAVRPGGKYNGHNLGPAISNAQTFEATTVNVRQHFRDDQMSGSREGVKGGEAVEAKARDG